MKLSKIKMPAKKSEKEMGEEFGLEMPSEEEGDDAAMDLESVEEGEEVMPPSEDLEGPAMLADISDDELMAELKKRGLSNKMSGKKPAPEMEASEESEEEYSI